MPPHSISNVNAMETITLTTKDGLSLVADYYPGTVAHAIILLHQYRADRHSYDAFAKTLNTLGYHVLNLDLRGHGDSEGSLDTMTDQDFSNMFYDAWAADEYIRSIDEKMSTQMIGASIGANTALRYQEMNTLESVVALSPGFNYHGIDARTSNMSNIAMPVLYINSDNDRYVEETRTLYEESPVTADGLTQLNLYPGDDHGAVILQKSEQARRDVIDWLNEHAGKGLAIFKDTSSIR